MNNDLKQLLESSKASQYKRISSTHPIDIDFGRNDENMMSMLITCDGTIQTFKNTNLIKVKNYKKNNQTILMFSLTNDSYIEIFLSFCNDIVECTKTGINDLPVFLLTRWNAWREMFNNPDREFLSDKRIQGLSGELYFLLKYMIPNYGIDEAVISWSGPDNSHRDFEIEETWFELKTISDGLSSVKISSIEQLDIDIDGHLVVYKVTPTTETNSYRVNLNILFDEIKEYIGDNNLMELFVSKLNKGGYYYNTYYDKKNFLITGNSSYNITPDCDMVLRKSNLPKAITSAEYYLDCKVLKEIEDDIWS